MTTSTKKFLGITTAALLALATISSCETYDKKGDDKNNCKKKMRTAKSCKTNKKAMNDLADLTSQQQQQNGQQQMLNNQQN